MRCHSCHRRCARCMYVATAVTTAARVCMACICARICARVFVNISLHSPSTARQPRRARTPRPAVATHPDTAPRSVAHAYSPGTSAGTCDFRRRQARQETEGAPNLSSPSPPKTPQKIEPRSGTFLCPGLCPGAGAMAVGGHTDRHSTRRHTQIKNWAAKPTP